MTSNQRPSKQQKKGKRRSCDSSRKRVPKVEEDAPVSAVSGVSSQPPGSRTGQKNLEAKPPSHRCLRIDCATYVCKLQDNRAQALPAYALCVVLLPRREPKY